MSGVQEIGGERVIAICGRICRLRLSGYGDYAVIPPEGFVASRDGCGCTAISVLTDGSCSCAPHDLTMRPVLREKKS